MDQETGIKSLAIPGMWSVNPVNWQGLSHVFRGVPIPGITRMGFRGSRVQSTIVADIEEMLIEDFANARLMVDSEYDDRPFYFKLAVRLSRLAAPIL